MRISLQACFFGVHHNEVISDTLGMRISIGAWRMVYKMPYPPYARARFSNKKGFLDIIEFKYTLGNVQI